MRIKREKVDTDQLKNKYENALEFYNERMADLPGNPYLVRPLSNRSFDLFFSSFLFDPDEEKIKLYLHLYAESSLAKFLMALNVGKEISFRINQASLSLTPDERDYEISVLKWINLFYAAILLKDADLLRSTADIDLDKVNDLTSSKTEKYNFHFAVFLQKWYKKAGNASDELLLASQTSNEVSKQSPLYDYMLDIGGPQIDLFSKIIYNEASEFNSLFKNAVQYHKNFFEGESKNGIINTAGIISLPLSAICLIAKNTGFHIETSSDFIWIT